MSGFQQRASGTHRGHLVPRPALTAGGPTIPFLIMMTGIVSTWLAVIVGLALDGTFHAPPASPPVATLLGIAVPPLVFARASAPSSNAGRRSSMVRSYSQSPSSSRSLKPLVTASPDPTVRICSSSQRRKARLSRRSNCGPVPTSQ